jgi:hypothetical protein
VLALLDSVGGALLEEGEVTSRLLTTGARFLQRWRRRKEAISGISQGSCEPRVRRPNYALQATRGRQVSARSSHVVHRPLAPEL